MAASIAVTREYLTASQLRAASSRAASIRAARRMLAIALVLEEADRTNAARSCGMYRQTLRDWVHRYNADGLAGLPPSPSALGHRSINKAAGISPSLRAARNGRRRGR